MYPLYWTTSKEGTYQCDFWVILFPTFMPVSFLVYESMSKTISKHDGGNTPINHINRI